MAALGSCGLDSGIGIAESGDWGESQLLGETIKRVKSPKICIPRKACSIVPWVRRGSEYLALLCASTITTLDSAQILSETRQASLATSDVNSYRDMQWSALSVIGNMELMVTTICHIIDSVVGETIALWFVVCALFVSLFVSSLYVYRNL